MNLNIQLENLVRISYHDFSIDKFNLINDGSLSFSINVSAINIGKSPVLFSSENKIFGLTITDEFFISVAGISIPGKIKLGPIQIHSIMGELGSNTYFDAESVVNLYYRTGFSYNRDSPPIQDGMRANITSKDGVLKGKWRSSTLVTVKTSIPVFIEWPVKGNIHGEEAVRKIRNINGGKNLNSPSILKKIRGKK